MKQFFTIAIAMIIATSTFGAWRETGHSNDGGTRSVQPSRPPSPSRPSYSGGSNHRPSYQAPSRSYGGSSGSNCRPSYQAPTRSYASSNCRPSYSAPTRSYGGSNCRPSYQAPVCRPTVRPYGGTCIRPSYYGPSVSVRPYWYRDYGPTFFRPYGAPVNTYSDYYYPYSYYGYRGFGSSFSFSVGW
jgi:hypothetical protein